MDMNIAHLNAVPCKRMGAYYTEHCTEATPNRGLGCFIQMLFWA